MKYFAGQRHSRHEIGIVHVLADSRRTRDVVRRADLLAAAAEAAGLARQDVDSLDTAVLQGVHSERYVTFLRDAWHDWIASFGTPEHGVIANVFPVMRTGGTYPTGIAGRIGIHMHDQLAPILKHTWEAALESANVAAAAARDVLSGARASYALCRPSGHHAGFDNGGGATYLNNAGVAAQVLRAAHERVLLVDVDVHHGNGTQDVFYARDDVYFLSLHRDPIDYHPYHWGHADERGIGPGAGFNLNVPLPADTGDTAFLAALQAGLDRGMATAPTALVVSLGFDAHAEDPSQGLQLSTAAYAAIAGQFAALGLPTVLVQEGGYNLDRAPECLTAFLNGFQA